MNEKSQPEYQGLLGQLVELIGMGATLRLCHDFGGTEVYFPKRLSADHPIVASVGMDAAQKLAEFAGQPSSGGTLDVPRGLALTVALRNKQILEEVARGATKKGIALKYGLTTRWVRSLCNDADDDDGRQGSLF